MSTVLVPVVTKTIQLGQIPQGSVMSWFMATQAKFNICVTLKDSKSTYVNNACRATTEFGPLSQGFQQVAGTKLTLTVTIEGGLNPQVVNQPISIPDGNGNIVANGYVLLFEDACDNDYNDLYVSIMSWKQGG
jgi:hypothetical protein